MYFNYLYFNYFTTLTIRHNDCPYVCPIIIIIIIVYTLCAEPVESILVSEDYACRPPSNFVRGHYAINGMLHCLSYRPQQLHEGSEAWFQQTRVAAYLPWPVLNRSMVHHRGRRRLKSGGVVLVYEVLDKRPIYDWRPGFMPLWDCCHVFRRYIMSHGMSRGQTSFCKMHSVSGRWSFMRIFANYLAVASCLRRWVDAMLLSTGRHGSGVQWFIQTPQGGYNPQFSCDTPTIWSSKGVIRRCLRGVFMWSWWKG